MGPIFLRRQFCWRPEIQEAMKANVSRIGLAVAIFAAAAMVAPVSARAQLSGMDPMALEDEQRNALRSLRHQADAFQNAVQTAPAYSADAGYDLAQAHFESFREAYYAFKGTLSAAPMAAGTANFAELDEGVAIIAQGVGDYRNAVVSGYSQDLSIHDICRGLADATKAWSQQLLTDCSRAQIPVY